MKLIISTVITLMVMLVFSISTSPYVVTESVFSSTPATAIDEALITPATTVAPTTKAEMKNRNYTVTRRKSYRI